MASDGRNPPYIDALHIIYAVAPTATQARTIRTVVCALSCWQRPLESLVLCSDVLEHPSPHSSGRWLKPMLAPLSSFLPGSHFTLSRGSSGPLRHRDRGCPHTGRCPHLHPPSLLSVRLMQRHHKCCRGTVLRTFLFRSFVSIFLICLY